MTTIEEITYYLFKLDRDMSSGYSVEWLCKKLQSYPVGWVPTVIEILKLRGEW